MVFTNEIRDRIAEKIKAGDIDGAFKIAREDKDGQTLIYLSRFVEGRRRGVKNSVEHADELPELVEEEA